MGGERGEKNVLLVVGGRHDESSVDVVTNCCLIKVCEENNSKDSGSG